MGMMNTHVGFARLTCSSRSYERENILGVAQCERVQTPGRNPYFVNTLVFYVGDEVISRRVMSFNNEPAAMNDHNRHATGLQASVAALLIFRDQQKTA